MSVQKPETFQTTATQVVIFA